MKNEVVLVDIKDKEIGKEEKLKAHQDKKLHRAFSVFIFNSKGELLLQKRAKSKYHSGGLWTNTCCSHPRPDKELQNEAEKRLEEEMGITCRLKKVFDFVYRADLRGLTEYEFDHVFFGKFEGNPSPNKKEVEGWKWQGEKELKKDIKENPEQYTAWFKIILDRAFEEFRKNPNLL